MNFKRFHESKNLFDKNSADIYNATTIVPADNQWIAYTGTGKTVRIPCESNTTYAISIETTIETSVFRVILITSDSVPVIGSPLYGTIAITSSSDNTAVFTTRANTKYIVLQFSASVFYDAIDSLMLVAGSQPLPYEPYDSEVWHDIPHYIMGTSTDTLTTLPAIIYANDTSVTVEITGNTGGVGDLVESGEHAGEYVIPIINNGVTTNIYNATALGISDSLTTTIPTTDGANTLSIGTTVQPSEVTVNYKGWHPVADVHERENGAWT